MWIGAATFDRSVGVSHLTGKVTHHQDIAADVDDVRNKLMNDFSSQALAEPCGPQWGVTDISRTANSRRAQHFSRHAAAEPRCCARKKLGLELDQIIMSGVA